MQELKDIKQDVIERLYADYIRPTTHTKCNDYIIIQDIYMGDTCWEANALFFNEKNNIDVCKLYWDIIDDLEPDAYNWDKISYSDVEYTIGISDLIDQLDYDQQYKMIDQKYRQNVLYTILG